MGERDRDAAGDQNYSVDKGQTPRLHRLRRSTAGGHKQRPGVGEIGPQMEVSLQVTTRTGQPRHRDDPGVEERAEEGSEKHNLRDDEPEHCHAVGTVEQTADHTFERLADNGTEPAEHHECDQCEPGVENRCSKAARGRCYLYGTLLNEVSRAERGQE